MASVSPALHVVKPNYSEARIVSPIKVSIDATALLDVIEALYHDNSESGDEEYTRLIGALLGTRSEDGNINVKTAYIIPHTEKDENFIFEDSHHFQTYQLYKRSNMDLQVVGWFQTNETFDISTGLLHEFFQNNSPKTNQILLTINHKDTEGNIVSPIINTYISSPIGLPQATSITQKLGLDKSGAYAFVSVENQIIYSKRELTSLKLINKTFEAENQTALVSNFDELKQLESTLSKISQMIQMLTDYTNKVINGELNGNDKIGQLLLSALKFQISEDEISYLKTKIEKHSNDILLIEYLSSCIKQQLELSSKLTNFMLPEDALKQ